MDVLCVHRSNGLRQFECTTSTVCFPLAQAFQSHKALKVQKTKSVERRTMCDGIQTTRNGRQAHKTRWKRVREGKKSTAKIARCCVCWCCRRPKWKSILTHSTRTHSHSHSSSSSTGSGRQPTTTTPKSNNT